MTLRRICSMKEWKEYKIGDICSRVCSGGTPSSKHAEYYDGDIPWLNTKEINFNRIYNTEKCITEEGLNNSSAKWIAENSVIVAMYGATAGKTAIAKIPITTNQACCNLTIDPTIADYRFVYYFLYYKFIELASLANGGAQQNLNAQIIKDFNIVLPSLEKQTHIANLLSSFDDKIEVNRRINDNFCFAFLEVILIWLLTSLENDNLEQQAMAIFDMMFPAVALGDDVIGNAITPKRGKGLLSKDAVKGNIPVVAGGLEPATYHNEPNTVAPVVTISASGANAGFVNLWQIPVWSSDSSFIDASMTKNVYFWYVMLKKRQKEIFDAQTGSAQPHIYPKHIAEMPLGIFEQTDVEKFTEIVTPMFEIRGRNLKESERLASIRDTLLPKLMSGELKLNEINV